ncbi:amidohydrolase family protein [Bosea sp. BK604]|uniref:amidohydrolase family protein n=1 Tax=Bosea sp. BK604 TaxID=2512180 RepID=UPI00104A3FF7|nr:amidohydrolase family protein [Bosea sp. BK604]TCR63167.1 hypothetical protein EV560_109261 [Bosea sp. BK604]
MNAQNPSAVQKPQAAMIADCDIHPIWNKPKDLYPYLSRRWQEHIETFGLSHRHGWQTGTPYPKGNASGYRNDAWPEDGGKPGSDFNLLKRDLLDANNIELGILNATGANGQGFQNLECAAAYCTAVNDWLIEEWTAKDPRLKASIIVSYEDAPAAVAEIERRAGDERFAQVMLLSRTAEPLGRRRYWPIYEAAERHGLPIGIHAFGFGGYPITGGGWPSYYIEEMVGHSPACQALLTSLIVEGVFARFPKLRVVLIEAGFAWLPALGWRLDKLWKTLKAETPALTRKPSEYIRDHIWITSQPMEEPQPREQLLDTMDWIGWDRLLFATDYPHWDYDDPAHSLALRISDENRRNFFRNNAREVYGR